MSAAQSLDRTSEPPTPSRHIVGESRELRQALAQVAVVAPTDATVLITGETGTGRS
jgi:transcriptional regulator with GAF, ATPase, and Fis domain